jgi:hypothetical protein
MKNDSFTLGDFIVERESKYPFFWIVKKDDIQLDRDQDLNDIQERFDLGVYDVDDVDEKDNS